MEQVRMMKALPLSLAALLLGATAASAELPLQTGTYQASGRNIRIAERDGRLCLQGYRVNTVITASINRPDSMGVYSLEGTSEVVYQQDLRTLLVGSRSDLSAYTLLDVPNIEPSGILQECLRTKRNFYNESTVVGSAAF